MACLPPTEEFTRRWGFTPWTARRGDRPPDGTLTVRWHGVYLADGEIFLSTAALRSAPRVETVTVHAAALEHGFVMHVVAARLRCRR